MYLRHPEVFLSTREEWNLSLWSSSKVELLHPECGTITVLVRVAKASRMMVIFTASHDDRFHSTPARRGAHRETGDPPLSGYKAVQTPSALVFITGADSSLNRTYTVTHAQTHTSRPATWISSQTNTPWGEGWIPDVTISLHAGVALVPADNHAQSRLLTDAAPVRR